MPPTEAALARRGGETFRPPARPRVWQLLIECEGRSGAENMAVDVGLLAEADRTGAAFLRLYRFAPPCLSLGRNEAALTRYDRAAIARLGVDVVRRPTGGGAVWHEGDLTYAVAAPIRAFGGLRRAYREIHARLAAALGALGARVTFAPERSRGGAGGGGGPCFAMPAGGELLVGGRKLVGSAQVRGGGAFLQHGSILLTGSQDLVAALALGPECGSLTGLRATSLAAVLGRGVRWVELAHAIVAAWGAAAAPSDPACPRPAASARFRDPAWTWRR